MEYFFLKLGAGNCDAEECLSKSRPEVAVYFDDLSQKDYEQGKGNSQVRLFCSRGESSNRKKTVITVIHQGRIWLLRPTGAVKFSKPWKHPDGHANTTKSMPVEVLFHGFCKDVPPVLAGMGSNQHHGRRTFTQVTWWGNLKAIDCVLRDEAMRKGNLVGSFATGEHWNPSEQGPAQLLECLGSTEIETLVGKLLEARGCHVPAYLGGTLKDIDILAYNDGEKEIRINGMLIEAGKSISIQVKTWASYLCPKSVDYFVSFDAPRSKKTFDAEWLLKSVKETPVVMEWMKRSLNWLPSEFLRRFGL